MTRRSTIIGTLWLLLLLSSLPAAAAPAIETSAANGTSVVTTTAPLPVDPLLVSAISSHVLPAEKCSDSGQCLGQPNYTPCDTPEGCVCYDPPGPSPSSCGRP